MPATTTTHTMQMGRSQPAHRRSTACANDDPQLTQISSKPTSQYGGSFARRFAIDDRTEQVSFRALINVNERVECAQKPVHGRA